jgi:hypothetical protein
VKQGISAKWRDKIMICEAAAAATTKQWTQTQEKHFWQGRNE